MPPQAESSPYVGTRYFARSDAHRFFGRGREIDELTALVIAHELVLVYAASGAGKTSLLNAGVAPELERHGFEVLPRGRVRGALPPGVVLEPGSNPYVLALLCSLAPQADIASLMHRTLVDYLSELPRPPGKTGRLLLVDQFEELFTYLPEQWQHYQREFIIELREALRDATDLRIVLAIRDDRVALIDDLAPLLPGGLRVRYHLEPLTRDEARQAVAGPLAGTGWSFGENVAERLVDDLSKVKLAVQAGGIREEVGSYVEPVQLQIVCSALWRNLPASTGPGVQTITAEQLQQFGDVEDTLERFYDEAVIACAREKRCDHERIARWFSDKLITPADTRGQVFQGPRDTEGLPNPVVEFLAERRLIHGEERASGRWLELSHDRLVQPVREVNRRWLARFDAARRQRRLRRQRWQIALITTAALAGAVVGLLVWNQRHEAWLRQDIVKKQLEESERNLAEERKSTRAAEHARIEGRVDELRELCRRKAPACESETAPVLDAVAHELWRKGDFERLATVLKQADRDGLIPADYGMPSAAAPREADRDGSMATDRGRRPASERTEADLASSIATDRRRPPASVSADADQNQSLAGVLRIEYNPESRIDPARVGSEWDRIARELVVTWGLPVARRIEVLESANVRASSVHVLVSQETCVEQPQRPVPDLESWLEIPQGQGDALISEAHVKDNAAFPGFFTQYRERERWKKLQDPAFGGPWWVVPRWTLPILRVAGQPPASRERMVTVVVANEVLKRPELVLGCRALQVALRHARGAARFTLKEALAARSLERLRLDLIEVVRGHQGSLRYLPTLLDALAAWPDLDSPDAVSRAIEDLATRRGTDHPLRGSWSKSATVEAELRPPSPGQGTPRTIDKEIADDFPATELPIRVELGPAIEPMVMDQGNPREDVLRRLGELRRDLYLERGIVGPVVRFRSRPDLEGLRIEILNQTSSDDDARPIAVPAAQALERVFGELGRRYRQFRTSWVTADTLQVALGGLPPGERAWLTRRYSLTDLKRLARAVIAEDRDADQASTLRDLRWIFGSLAFWTHVHPGDVPVATLAGALRDTQRARLRGTPTSQDGAPFAVLIAQGFDALDADRIDDAEARFRSAIGMDRDAAVAAFPAMYAARSVLAPGRRARWLAGQCALPQVGGWVATPAASIAYEVQDLLDADARAAADSQMPAAERRGLELCVLWSVANLERRPREVQERTVQLVARAPELWTREQAYFLALRWLRSNRQEFAPRPTELVAIRALLSRSLGQLPDSKVMEAVRKDLLATLGNRPWRWGRQPIADAAAELPNGRPSLKLELAFWLSDFGEDDVARALPLVDAVDPGVTADDQWARAWVRGRILGQQGHYGSPEQRGTRLAEAAELLRRLARGSIGRRAAWTYSELANVEVRRGNVAAARAAIRDGIARSGDPARFEVQRFFIELGADDTRLARAVAADMVRRNPDGEATMFVDAILATLTGRDGFESTARRFIFHDAKDPSVNADYVRFLLYQALSRTGRDARAAPLIDARMREIQPETWPQRLAQGDSMVWREMLLAVFAGRLPAAELLGKVADDDAAKRSGLRNTELSLGGLRCEAYFYLALRDRVTGDVETRTARYRAGLERVIELEERDYFEDRMARFLLAHPEL